MSRAADKGMGISVLFEMSLGLKFLQRRKT